MIENKRAILFFVKYPAPGKVKTRLAKTLGDEQAARIYSDLAVINFKVLRTVLACDLIVMFDPPERKEEIKEWLKAASYYVPQKGQDLGERLKSAFESAFDNGYEKVMAVGSDILGLTASTIEEGFRGLDESDVCIGPAKDGGYYLIGSCSYHPQLFENISWSTDIVLEETRNIIKRQGLHYRILTPLEDLDEIQPGGMYEFINNEFKKRRS